MSKLTYPVTRRSDHTDDYHGTKVATPYRWLEDLNAPETDDWITAQNAITFEHLSSIPQRKRVKERLTALWDFPKVGAPFKRGERYFQFRNTGLQNQDVLTTMATYSDEGCILIDPNKLSEDGTIALTGIGVSRDGNWIAYATSGSGSDWKTWRIRNVDTGEDLPDVIEWSKFAGVAWLPDSSGFFYGRYAAPEEGTEYAGANYNQQLYLHRLNTLQTADKLAYERPDHPKWGFEPVVTDDGRVFLAGGIDMSQLLSRGTPEEVGEAGKETIAKASPGGGHILASSNSIHPAVEPRNYRAMVQAAREFGRYPIDERLVADYATRSYIARYMD